MALAPLNDPRAERAESNWNKVRRTLRLYFVLTVLPVIALIWAAGYGKGLLDAYRSRCPEPVVILPKESDQ